MTASPNRDARERTSATAIRRAIDAGAAIQKLAKSVAVALTAVVGLHAGNASAATGTSSDWIPWVVLGAIALLIVGVLLRMVIAARFPKGYRAWARSRRDAFADQNAKWDAEDDARR